MKRFKVRKQDTNNNNNNSNDETDYVLIFINCTNP